MVVHLVFFRFKEENKKENMLKAKKDLEALKMDGLLRLEVGLNFAESGRAWDLSLTSEFTSREALEEYANYEPHVAIKKFLGEVCNESAVVDYEK